MILPSTEKLETVRNQWGGQKLKRTSSGGGGGVNYFSFPLLRHNNQFLCDHFPPGTISLDVSLLGCFRNFGQSRAETFLKLRVVYSAA